MGSVIVNVSVDIVGGGVPVTVGRKTELSFSAMEVASQRIHVGNNMKLLFVATYVVQVSWGKIQTFLGAQSTNLT